MVDVYLAETVVRTRFRQRIRRTGASGLAILSSDLTRATRLSERSVARLLDFLDARLAASSRLTRRCCLLNIPLVIALCGMMWNVPALSLPFDLIDHIHPGLSVLLLTCGIPLAMIARHSLIVARTRGRLDALLARFPSEAVSVGRAQRLSARAEQVIVIAVGLGLVGWTSQALVPGAVLASEPASTAVAVLAAFAAIALIIRGRRPAPLPPLL